MVEPFLARRERSVRPVFNPLKSAEIRCLYTWGAQRGRKPGSIPGSCERSARCRRLPSPAGMRVERARASGLGGHPLGRATNVSGS
jgi:hypothetical protein